MGRWRARERAALVIPLPAPGQAPLCSPLSAEGVWVPGAKDVRTREPQRPDCPPGDPDFCNPRLQSAARPQPALRTSAAQRPRAPAATRSSRTPRPARSTGRARAAPAAGPLPRSLGPGPLRTRREARRRRIRSPAGSGSEPPTGARDLPGPRGAQRGTEGLETLGRPL